MVQRARNAIPSSSRNPLPNTHRFAIRFSYDGTEFHGFQSQSNPSRYPTVQDELERRLQSMLKRNIRVLGWGRTDTGVHAHGAVCTVDLSIDEIKRLSSKRQSSKNAAVASSVDKKKKKKNESNPHHSIVSSEELTLTAITLQSALKQFACGPSHTPGSITARRCVPVPPTFDARFSCIWKRYVYTISCCKVRSPFLSRYAWEMDTLLDHSAMVQAASLLSGTHNFSWLSVIEPGDEMDPIRTVNLVVDCLEDNRHTSTNTTAFWNAAASSDTLSPILFRISATTDFFLYKMTRRIVGALVAIGSGKVKISDLEDCIIRHDNHDAGRESSSIPHGLLQTAPACGLCLDHVEYNITI